MITRCKIAGYSLQIDLRFRRNYCIDGEDADLEQNTER